MTPKERAAKTQALINELLKMADVSAWNYKQELAEYRRIFVDTLTLIRDDALAEDAALASEKPAFTPKS